MIKMSSLLLMFFVLMELIYMILTKDKLSEIQQISEHLQMTFLLGLFALSLGFKR